MKIGFDVSQTGRFKAGCGYFADSLIRSLAKTDSENDYVLYPTFGDNFWDEAWAKEVCHIEKTNFSFFPGPETLEEVKDFWRAPDLDVKLGSPDVVHANNFFCPVGLRDARLVYTLYDLTFIEHPELTTEENRCGCFKGVFEAGHRADLIVAISEHTRRHFLRIFPHFPADRVRVVRPGSRFTPNGTGVRPWKLPSSARPEGFWLNVGTVEPRKNLKGLLEAYALLKSSGKSSYPLVLAGGNGWMMGNFKRQINEMGLSGSVFLLGYVKDAELRWLYQNAFAFVYPSLFEGFGLPVLEAMTLGAPVIASSLTSLPEIVGDAGLLIDPRGPRDIFEAMLRLVSDRDLRCRLRSSGAQRAKLFSWDAAGRCVRDIYEEVRAAPPLPLRRVPVEVRC